MSQKRLRLLTLLLNLSKLAFAETGPSELGRNRRYYGICPFGPAQVPSSGRRFVRFDRSRVQPSDMYCTSVSSTREINILHLALLCPVSEIRMACTSKSLVFSGWQCKYRVIDKVYRPIKAVMFSACQSFIRMLSQASFPSCVTRKHAFSSCAGWGKFVRREHYRENQPPLWRKTLTPAGCDYLYLNLSLFASYGVLSVLVFLERENP